MRLHVVGQIDVLQKADLRLLQREIVIDAVLEGDADEGQAVKRGRADIVDAGRRREAHFHRDGVKALHLFGGKPCRLRGDLKDHRRGVGIGLDVELRECDAACHDEGDQQSTTIGRRVSPNVTRALST